MVPFAGYSHRSVTGHGYGYWEGWIDALCDLLLIARPLLINVGRALRYSSRGCASMENNTSPDISSAPRFLHRLTFPPPFLVSLPRNTDKERERERYPLESSRSHAFLRCVFLPALKRNYGGLYFVAPGKCQSSKCIFGFKEDTRVLPPSFDERIRIAKRILPF